MLWWGSMTSAAVTEWQYRVKDASSRHTAHVDTYFYDIETLWQIQIENTLKHIESYNSHSVFQRAVGVSTVANTKVKFDNT